MASGPPPLDRRASGSSTAPRCPPARRAQQDLKAALDAIFNHPNIGPFFAGADPAAGDQQPQPGLRLPRGQVFANNGQGVRGDLKAVVARHPARLRGARAERRHRDQGYGHLREPIVRLGDLLRTFNAQAPTRQVPHLALEDPTCGLAQNPLRSPTVFNFFSPTTRCPGRSRRPASSRRNSRSSPRPRRSAAPTSCAPLLYYGYDQRRARPLTPRPLAVELAARRRPTRRSSTR